MKLIRFFKTKTFWANLILAAVAVMLLIWGLTAWLGWFTHHRENVAVPELARLSFEEGVETLENSGLRHEILDSAEFDPGFPRGSIIGQYPYAGALVKEGRVIKLTINPLKPKKIEMPELKEKTKRRAVYDLQSKGFEIGELEYVAYIGKDVVVDVKVDGRKVSAGQKFEKGTVVVLVLGKGLDETLIVVPYLGGLNLAEAESRLRDLSLNMGATIFDAGVTDSAAARIYRQQPQASGRPAIPMGGEVDIWLTDDYTKVPADSLRWQYEMDTTANAGPRDTAG